MATRAVISNFPAISVGGGLEVQKAPKAGRVTRRPSHPFYLQYRPYTIQPFCIAPVLPGETMKNALIQARCVTDPIKNPLIGWWNEYYLFYVKLTDLTNDGRWDVLSDMLLKNAAPAGSMAPYADANMYQNAGGVSFVYSCLDRIVQTYFRDEEEVAANAYATGAAFDLVSGTLKAKAPVNSGLLSLTLDSDTPATEDEELPGQGYPDLPSHLSGFADQYAQWQEMVAMKMTEATFDDWLKSFGVRAPREEKEELHIPELIRYMRDFSYPSNTVNPADGSVASAVSWSIAERADKDRFFREPGFLFGVTTTRPKVYLSKQTSALSNYLNDAFSWLPALLSNDPYTSLRKFDEGAANGPVKDLASDYWLDMKDLFIYGDQFTNLALTAANLNVVSLPDDSAVTGFPLNPRYASDADITAFFADSGSATVRVDGRIDFSILSRLHDTTP